MKRITMNKKREKEKISLNTMGAVGDHLKREFKELRGRGARFFSQKIRIFWEESAGQSLMEVVIALAIGAILIGGASTAIVVVLQSSKTSQIQRSATVLTQEIVEEARTYGMADWSNLYGLSKTSSTKYFFNTTSTEFFHIEGIEGLVEGDIQAGLVGHWKLDEATSTTAYDYSGNGNHGSTSGAVATSTDNCKVGKCYDFDGTVSDYIEIPHSASLNLTDEITVSAWTKPRIFTYNERIVHKGTANVSLLYMKQDYWDGGHKGWNFGVSVGGTKYAANYSTANTGVWQHLVGTYDGETVKIYVNGIHRGSNTNPSGSMDTTTSAYEITTSVSDGDSLDGLVDDVRIYDRALSANEVEHLYNSTLFNRYFYVENACRTNNADYKPVGAVPCGSGEVEDPSTQLITGVVEWAGKEGESSFSLSEYVTRWRNEIFHQTDWSGGSGQEGPVSESTNKYSSSTDIDYSNLGEIRIEDL